MFRSFRVYNFRIWFIGAVASNLGTWMMNTALSWVVLTELTDNDALAMGAVIALQFAPPLILVPVTGWATDRFDRRWILFVTQIAFLLLSVALGVLILTGILTLQITWCFALALGITSAFDNPPRLSFVSDVVEREAASNAVALNAASYNLARMIGPALAGVLIVVVGSGWVFVVSAVTLVGMLVMLLLLRTRELIPQVRNPGSAGFSDGLRYVRHRPDIVVIFVMVFLLGAFGLNFPVFASTMALEFNQGADGYGFLSSILAIGSITGALMGARRDRARIRIILVGGTLYAIAAISGSLMPTFWLYAVTLVLMGFATVTMLNTANAYVQTNTDPTLRGRVMALYLAVILGSTFLGAPAIGWAAEVVGPRFALMIAGAAAVAAVLIGAIWMLATGRVRRHEAKRFRVVIDATAPIDIIAPKRAPKKSRHERARESPRKVRRR